MARYGREYMGGAYGRRRRGLRRPAYGPEYGRVRGFGAEPEGPERLGYDYEFGGRGWPYEEPRAGRPFRRGRRPLERREAYDWEMRRPEAFGMGYGYEYVRSGAPGYRRARGRRLRRETRGGEYGERWSRPQLGYEGEFAGRAYGGRPTERGYESPASYRADYDIEMTGRAGMLSGNTPPDRWPDIGHDVSDRPSREQRMSDGEIREAVLENLFQDTWVDPDRIDVEVDNGVVTLSGEVRDFMEARYAWDDAWESAGVRGVINHLTVRTDRPQDEMELPQTSGSRRSRTEGGG